ncbi:hypothetical protein Ate01nite_68720 [Actinoplanes teichomyceticus]|nr:hypothetical protein Ate01nite_68720 [Actinoplanes teichomyceticus]
MAAAALLALVAGCGSSGSRPTGAAAAAAPGATKSGSATAPDPSAAAASAGPNAPEGGPGAGLPESAAAGTGVPESVSAALAALPPDLRARIPRFPPAPAATRVALPGGDKAAFFSHIPTTQKVAFITIDDGWAKNPLALRLFQAANVPVTLFLEVDAIKDDPGYFTPLKAAGATIENHTITHATMTRLSYPGQKREICGGADRLAQLYGDRPTLFRPPGGAYNGTTLRAAHDCGMKAVFNWTQTTDHGKIFYQGTPKVVKPGDIILMHFRPRFVDDFLAVLEAIHKNGLTPARLEDYIP